MNTNGLGPEAGEKYDPQNHGGLQKHILLKAVAYTKLRTSESDPKCIECPFAQKGKHYWFCHNKDVFGDHPEVIGRYAFCNQHPQIKTILEASTK